ncbi:MAG: methionine--tRNA ligase [Candidatus Taylorbacteria bacterium]
MSSKTPWYITTTLPYVNAEPHIGFAMEFIRADIIVRSKKLAGHEVFFNTGTDEHGTKIHRRASEMNMDTQGYVDKAADTFKALIPLLGVTPEVNFVRTTDPHHIAAAQEFWITVQKNGYIYKKNYSVKYCVGCELEKTESELVDGRCALHPLTELEIIQEENYFFKFSAFQDKLLALYENNPHFVYPYSRLNEIRAFVERGLEDFSISRLATKMPWGIAVPNDADHVMYVWFDALVNYISAIGWPDRMNDFKKWWIDTGGVVQYCGKDNLRQQTAMLQAMLMAAELPPSQAVIVDGFITGEGGIKMSKSLGNTVHPTELVTEYGTDAVRYYMARELSPFEDSPFTLEKFKEAYNANLANGIGNLTSRIMKMAETNAISLDKKDFYEYTALADDELVLVYKSGLAEYDVKKSADAIWKIIGNADGLIQSVQPFKLLKSENADEKKKGKDTVISLLKDLYKIGLMLRPFMPTTSESILTCVTQNKMPASPLFLRK